MTELLRLEGIEKSYGPTRVLRGIGFSVAAKEVVGLFGPNGSGKTTLANIVSGLVAPDRGRILLEGKDITRMSMDARFRAGIARTFQIPDPYPSLTVLESVRVALLCGEGGPRDRSGAARNVDSEAEAILRRTGLFAQRLWPAAGLSQGCLRRLEFARGLACRPRLLILDELFSSLSAADEADLTALLRAANRDDGTAFLLVSHNPPLLKSLCRRILVLEEGRIVRERTV